MLAPIRWSKPLEIWLHRYKISRICVGREGEKCFRNVFYHSLIRAARSFLYSLDQLTILVSFNALLASQTFAPLKIPRRGAMGPLPLLARHWIQEESIRGPKQNFSKEIKLVGNFKEVRTYYNVLNISK